MIYFDGKIYENEADVPDFGSIENTGAADGKRQYQGHEADLAKLPKYVKAGSTCMMVDTGNVYMFSEQRQAWEKVGG